MSGRVKCALFDLDGTLVSTGGAGNRALEKAFVELYRLPNAMERINPAGKTDPAIIREIFVLRFGRACTDGEMAKVQESYLSHLPEECRRAERYRVMEGIPAVLNSLAGQGVLLGLGTGNIERGARIKLERSGLNPLLPFGGFGSDSEQRPALLRVGLEKARRHSGLEVHPENVFVIGDTERDILAARSARFKVIAVATGHAPLDFLAQYEPDFLLPDFREEEKLVSIICKN